MGGSLTNLGSDLGETTPAKGREAQVCTPNSRSHFTCALSKLLYQALKGR